MIRTNLAVTVLLVLSGCAPHAVQYYQISVVTAPAAAAPTGPTVLVERIATPQALQDGRIRYREGPNAVGAYEFHRWTDPPGIMVREALIHGLRASGKFKSVREAGSSADGDYYVRGKLVEFSEMDAASGITTRVSLDLELRDAKTGRLVWNDVLTHDDPVQAKKVADVVQSLDRNLQTVIGNAASAIGSYTAAHPITAPK